MCMHGNYITDLFLDVLRNQELTYKLYICMSVYVFVYAYVYLRTLYVCI